MWFNNIQSFLMQMTFGQLIQNGQLGFKDNKFFLPWQSSSPFATSIWSPHITAQQPWGNIDSFSSTIGTTSSGGGSKTLTERAEEERIKNEKQAEKDSTIKIIQGSIEILEKYVNSLDKKSEEYEKLNSLLKVVEDESLESKTQEQLNEFQEELQVAITEHKDKIKEFTIAQAKENSKLNKKDNVTKGKLDEALQGTNISTEEIAGSTTYDFTGILEDGDLKGDIDILELLNAYGNPKDLFDNIKNSGHEKKYTLLKALNTGLIEAAEALDTDGISDELKTQLEEDIEILKSWKEMNNLLFTTYNDTYIQAFTNLYLTIREITATNELSELESQITALGCEFSDTDKDIFANSNCQRGNVFEYAPDTRNPVIARMDP